MPVINVGTVVWADLHTPDLEQAKSFYGQLLGWEFATDPKTPSYVLAQLNGRNVAGIAQQGPESPIPTAWSTYFATEDADAFAKAATSAGAQLVLAPTDVTDAGRKAHFVDPTGAHFAVWQPKKRHGAEIMGEPGSMTFHEVYTQQPDATRAFYARVMGLEAKKVVFTAEGFTGLDYWTMHSDDLTVGGVGPKLPPGQPARWHTYFAAEDVDDCAKRIGELGGSLLMSAFSTPYGKMLIATDPAGAIFALIHPTKPFGQW